jgi:hypothetical protein
VFTVGVLTDVCRPQEIIERGVDSRHGTSRPAGSS